MDDHKKLFQKACLIQLSTSVWQCTKVLNEKTLVQKLGQDNEWLRGRKFLINPELLGPVKTAVQQARKTIQKYSLPFPITSIYLIPKESLGEINERMEYYKTRFWNKAITFEALYESAREEAESVLENLFNEADYPADILTKFKFEWRYFEVSTPSKSKILTPEIYEREKEKFIRLMDETRELSMTALRTEFGAVVSNLVNRLTGDHGKPKQITNTMFNKLHEFIEDFSTRNLFKDEDLKAMTEEAKAIVFGISPYALKYNDVLQKKISSKMEELNSSISEAIKDIPRRKLKLAVNE